MFLYTLVGLSPDVLLSACLVNATVYYGKFMKYFKEYNIHSIYYYFPTKVSIKANLSIASVD